MKTLLKVYAFVSMLLLGVGCAPTIHTTKVAGMTTEISRASEIAIFKEKEPLPRPYQILGNVFVEKRGATIFSKPNEEYLFKQMKKHAAIWVLMP